MTGGDSVDTLEAGHPPTDEPRAPLVPSFVVGLGASAGGLEALERFFDRLPADTGMAFVVVQHLSPDFKSLMDDILSRRTTMAVRVAEEGVIVEPNTVYLNPPKKLMVIVGGSLRLTDKDPAVTIAYPIDHFLRSLAIDAPSRCAAIIFSGTGSDGSRGIADIRSAGGLVIAQEPSSAGFDGMPRSAIESGAVDVTLAPEEMAAALRSYADGGDPRGAPEHLTPLRGLSAMTALLRNAYGIDFEEYKLPTIARRTERRLRACGDGDLDQYVERLTRDPKELDALYRDLLIGVTQFFRDGDAFEALEAQLLPDVLRKLGPGDEFRAWVAGCATGEEAYSLAILLRETLDALGLPNPVRIFATDVHREALRFAASGVYDEASVAQVSPARRARYFALKDGAYHVVPEIRSMVVFAAHNVVHEVPFNKLDFVSCRNLLIYFQPVAQRRAVTLFHFGLKPGGLLFLGSSESLAELADEFEIVDAHWKIFRKRRDGRVPAAMPSHSPSALRARDIAMPLAPAAVPDPMLIGTYDALLDELMPPSILIGARRNLVQSFGGASRFLHVPEGRATNDAVEMLRDDLRVAVTGAFQRVLTEHHPVRYRDLRVDLGSEAVLVDVTARQIKNRRSGELHVVVSFDEQRPAPRGDGATPAVPVDQIARDQIAALELDLRHAKENLQTTIEELETSNEELQATNEELVASNEELQTTNEELHSVNQELFTINAEYQKKITELTQLTADMDLLLASTEVHTLFLDRDLRIRRFTPTIGSIFHLVPGDVGRRIEAFNHSLGVVGLYDDVRRVAATGATFERQVSHGASWYLLRVLPYRKGPATDGAVLTLVDITAMKHFEREARSKDEQLSTILTNSPHPVFIRDTQRRYVVVDDSFRRLAGRDPEGLLPEDVFPPDVAATLARDDARILGEGVTIETEETIPTPTGPRAFLSVKFPMRGTDGAITGIGGIQTDVTSLKRAEAEARDAANRRDRFLATLSHELRNPLAAVLNASRVIARGGVDERELHRWHDVILERAQHMARLVDDLLDVARLTQDKLVLKPEHLDLRATAKGVIDEVSERFLERGILLTTEADVALPIFGDVTRLQQLQVNLLTNAARHTPRGGTTTYSLRRDGDFAEICVADTGEGIEPAMLQRIFELFEQGDEPGARGRDGGLGVGLALVRRLAELHGGTVTASSRGQGRGAEFRVRLPLDASPPPAPPDTTPPGEATSPGLAAPRRPRLVLLVDDDGTSRSAMRKLLELDGIIVTTAEGGAEALALLAHDALPDLVLLDIGLPGMDGYEVCRRMRALPGGDGLTIYALTGFGQDSDREAAARAGFDEHLTKPVDVDAIYELYARG